MDLLGWDFAQSGGQEVTVHLGWDSNQFTAFFFWVENALFFKIFLELRYSWYTISCKLLVYNLSIQF